MPEALAKVKRALGPDAVILRTRTITPQGITAPLHKPQVEITAARADHITTTGPQSFAPKSSPPTNAPPAETHKETADATPSLPPTPMDAYRQNSRPATTPQAMRSALPAPQREPAAPRPKQDPDAPPSNAAASPPEPPVPPDAIQRFYRELVKNEVAADVARNLARQYATILANTPPDQQPSLPEVLRDVITRLTPVADGITIERGQHQRIALVGPAGSGKTSTLCKLAARVKLQQRRDIAILSLDMHRIGASDQLKRYADLIEVPFRLVQSLDELQRALRVFGTTDCLLIDTPGLGLRDRSRFVRLAALLRAAHPNETYLVLPATAAHAVQVQCARSFASLGVSKVILTRLDDVVGFGVLVNVLQQLQWGLAYLSTGQKIPDDLQPACRQRVAQLLFPQQSGC